MVDFTPLSKNSSNILKTINEFAKEKQIEKEDIDFDLLGVETFIQTQEGQEWLSIQEPLETMFNEETLISPDLQIRQEYKIRIRPFKKNKFFEQINMAIASNKEKSKVIAIFKKGTLFPCDEHLAKQLKREITRRKLYLGLLAAHFESDLNTTLLKLAKSVKCGSELSKDIRVTIASFAGPVFATDDALIHHYKNIKKKDNNLLHDVDANELILEYIKPALGSNGRDCRGIYVSVAEPKVLHSNYKIDEQTIRAAEDDKSIKYYSIINGYVKELHSVFSISKEVMLASASFRKTGSIDTGDDKDISMSIQNNDSSDDAIGGGIHIEVKELDVKGTVGSNTSVKATELSIGEQTHRNSHLEAVQNAKIHLHRGNLKAKTAEIEILENGTVKADDVHVKKMLGGEIIGHRVIVEEITSNTVIIASESIEIHTITGEHNKLIIDPNRIEAYHEKIETLKEELSSRKKELKIMKEDHQKKVIEHQERLERIKVFKARIQKATKDKNPPNKADIVRLKQYNIEAEKLRDDLEDIHSKENDIHKLNFELEKLYEAELHAKIICHGRYDGHTQVVFMSIKTSKEYTMSPQGVYKELHLVKDGNDIKIG